VAKVCKIYDVEKNDSFSTHTDKEQAITDVDSLCALDHTSGTFEVHELDEADLNLADSIVVYRCRA
jgi:hypothetical protein